MAELTAEDLMETITVDYKQMLDTIHALQVDLMLFESALEQHKPTTLPYVSTLVLEILHGELEDGLLNVYRH